MKIETGRTRAWAWTSIVGVIGGAFSGFFGVGGAFVAPPLLTTFFGLRQLEAQGLGLALVSPSALLALLAYVGAGQVDWLVGLPLAIGGIAAISGGVTFASRLPERRMRLAFCGLLLITAVLLAMRKRSVRGLAQAAAVASSGCQFQGNSSAMRRAG